MRGASGDHPRPGDQQTLWRGLVGLAPDTPLAPEAPEQPIELWTVLPATAENVRVARRLLAGWLDALRWPDEERMDLLLAVNEAIANVVDHAYPPGTVTGRAHLHAWEAVDSHTGQRRVVTVVIDHGHWRTAAVDPGYRGRGLRMMDYCMASVYIEPTPHGTTVIMTSKPIDSISQPATQAG
jgi:anti-sigma regulatory factor (Ser/Thr protein kinase)